MLSSWVREHSPPFLDEREIWSKIFSIVNQAYCSLSPEEQANFFDLAPNSQRIEPRDLFPCLIEFTDELRSSLPPIFPDSYKVEALLDRLLNRERIAIDDVFRESLTIQRHLLGALLLAWISSRLVARLSDRRIYPYLELTEKVSQLWAEKLVPFEGYDQPATESPGDYYYFFTHALAAYLFGRHGSYTSQALDAIFSRGTEIMVIARRWCARKPNRTSHRVASMIGREVGRGLCELASDPTVFLGVRG